MDREILENLHKSTNEFEKHLAGAREIVRALKSATTKVVDGMHELRKIIEPSANTCTICFENPRRYVARPCGHCFCVECKTRCEATTPTRCFTCRALVRQLFRVYL